MALERIVKLTYKSLFFASVWSLDTSVSWCNAISSIQITLVAYSADQDELRGLLAGIGRRILISILEGMLGTTRNRESHGSQQMKISNPNFSVASMAYYLMLE
jgi:hypothetical protein